MINLMENKVLGPLIRQQFEQGEQKGRSEGEQKGRSEGRQEGRQKGRQDLLLEQLTEKFGPLPVWAMKRLEAASSEDLHTWAKRILRGTTLEDTLR